MTRERPNSGRPAALTLRAPAKVNLFLEVTARRPDGYHELAHPPGRRQPVRRADVRPGRPAIRLSCTDPTLGTGPENLVVRAAEAPPPAHRDDRAGAAIGLTKRIPVAAGLGGGSSDAATTLVGLNRLWKLRLSRDELIGLAARLGSDVPFFLQPAGRVVYRPRRSGDALAARPATAPGAAVPAVRAEHGRRVPPGRVRRRARRPARR